jgi:hypothetical protein
MKNKLLFAVALGLGIAVATPFVTNAQSATQTVLDAWRVVSGFITPRNSANGLKVPSLGSTGNPCVSVSSTGAFATTTCGSGGGTPAGSDTQIQFNDGGAFGASANLVWDDAQARLILAGTLFAENTGAGYRSAADFTANSNDGNESAAFLATAQGTGVNNAVFAQAKFGTENNAIYAYTGDLIVRNGTVKLSSDAGTTYAILDTSLLASSNKTFTFPDQSGTLCIVGVACDGAGGGGISTSTTAQIGKSAFWTGLATLGNGALFDNGTVAGVNATSSTISFNVQGNAGAFDPFNIASSSGTSFLRVTQAGRVGIGVSAPVTAFHVAGSTATNGFQADCRSTGLCDIVVDTPSGQNGRLIFAKGGTNTLTISGGATNGNTPSISISGSAPAFNINVAKVGFSTNTPATSVDIYGTTTLDPFNVSSSSNVSLFRITAAGNVGIGTTTPGSKLLLQGSAGSTSILFTVASSTGATILSVLPNGSVNIATSTQNPYHTLNVDGTVNSTWRNIKCEVPVMLEALTSDSNTNRCEGVFEFDEDGQGATTNTLAYTDGIPALQMWAGATAATSSAVAAGDGAALTINRASQGSGWASASTTPIFEALVYADPTNATATVFQLGFGVNGQGTDHSVKTGSGYYFIATSTDANWQAAAQESGSAGVFADTGIPSTTPAQVWNKFNIVITMNAATSTAAYYINDSLVATLTPSFSVASRKSALSPFVAVGTTANGLAKNIRVAYIRAWARLRP